MKILMIFGTRPEAVKMCPLAIELRKHKEFECKICLTGQHREILSQMMQAFGIEADYDLEIMRENQTLNMITSSVLEKLDPVLEKEDPDIVLVHGDTTTSFAAALASFFRKITVGHVEAGLRTGNIYSPFPEEMNRLLSDRICTYYFAPTELNRQNLIKEGIKDNIFVTGNTVIDSFEYTVSPDYTFSNVMLKDLDFQAHRVIPITAHRRENLGQPLVNICNAILKLASMYKDIIFVYPVHPNPAVKDTVYDILSGLENVILTDPLDVFDMHNLLSRCFLVMTDSGGLQEEAPYFGKPVIVLRTETERPEAVSAGTVKVVGVSEENIIFEVSKLLNDNNAYEKMSMSVNPYGDGHASQRIADILLKTISKS